MKTPFYLTLMLLVLSGSAFSKTFKFPVQFTNVEAEDLTIGYDVGYTFSATTSSPNGLGNLPSKGSATFQVKAESGQKVFILVHIGGAWLVTATIDVGNKKPEEIIKYISKPKYTSTNAAKDESTLNKLLSKVGESAIGSHSGTRLKLDLSVTNAMATLCGALVILDPKDIPEDGEITNNHIKTYLYSYYLNSAPTKLNLDGQDINEMIEYDNSHSVGINTSFPLAGSFDFNLNGADYYKVQISAKNAGWAILEFPDGATYSERMQALSEQRKEAIALMIKSKLDECKSCKIYPIDKVFYYESLTASTTKYNRLQGAVDVSVSSVVSSNGAYKRNEAQDLFSTRGSTIVYFGLGGDITMPLVSLSNKVLQLAALKEIQGTQTSAIAIVDEVSKNATPAPLADKTSSEPITVKSTNELVDKKFLDEIKASKPAELKKIKENIEVAIEKESNEKVILK